MRTRTLLALLLLGGCALPAQQAYPPADCPSCAAWNAPQQPFRVVGNTWYVGTRGLSAILLTSEAGHILLDAGLPESAAPIAASIRALGFRVEDVKLIVNSHAHYDHAGGIAALQRLSGARVVAHPWSARMMRSGFRVAGDPQFSIALRYPAVARVEDLVPGDTVRVGPLAIVPHATGGHTPGGTTWTWRACEGDTCRDVVYADSQTPVSADDFLFTRNTAYPEAVADFERGFATLERLACDILLTPHPGASELFARHEAHARGDVGAFRRPGACRAYAATARRALAARIERERADGR